MFSGHFLPYLSGRKSERGILKLKQFCNDTHTKKEKIDNKKLKYSITFIKKITISVTLLQRWGWACSGRKGMRDPSRE